eukprot:2548633-Rhodomonas_salina.4
MRNAISCVELTDLASLYRHMPLLRSGRYSPTLCCYQAMARAEASPQVLSLSLTIPATRTSGYAEGMVLQRSRGNIILCYHLLAHVCTADMVTVRRRS